MTYISKETIQGMFSRPDLKTCKDFVEGLGCNQKIKHIVKMREGQKALTCGEAHPDQMEARVQYDVYRYDGGFYITGGWTKLPTFFGDNNDGIDVVPDRIVVNIPDFGRFVFTREDGLPFD